MLDSERYLFFWPCCKDHDSTGVSLGAPWIKPLSGQLYVGQRGQWKEEVCKSLKQDSIHSQMALVSLAYSGPRQGHSQKKSLQSCKQEENDPNLSSFQKKPDLILNLICDLEKCENLTSQSMFQSPISFLFTTEITATWQICYKEDMRKCIKWNCNIVDQNSVII